MEQNSQGNAALGTALHCFAGVSSLSTILPRKGPELGECWPFMAIFGHKGDATLLGEAEMRDAQGSCETPAVFAALGST